MSRAEFTAGAFASAGVQAGSQAVGLQASSRGSALYREVQADVADFIENGSTNSGSWRAGGSAGFAMPSVASPAEAARIAALTGGPTGWVGAAGFASMQPSSWPAAVRPSSSAGASAAASTASPAGGVGSGGTGVSAEAQREFLDRIAPLAQKAGERLGVAPDLVAAQAALESGWGRRPLRRADGSDTHNLFGLKAGGGWSGEAVDATTHEQSGATLTRRVEPFRSYGDASAGFDDYASLLAGQPRFRGALGTGDDARAFADGLAQGGYATDTAYADKLVRLAEQVRAMKARP